MLNQIGEFAKLDRPDFIPALKLVLFSLCHHPGKISLLDALAEGIDSTPQ